MGQSAKNARDSGITGRLAANVGNAIRLRRTALEMTMAELARLSGVSGPFISLLERGRSSISLETLYRVADALETKPNLLLPDSKSRAHRSGNSRAVSKTATLINPGIRQILGDTAGDKQMKATLIALEHDGIERWSEHRGEAFVYMLHGRLAIEYSDGKSILLGPGESAHHPSTSIHRCALLDAGRTEILLVNAGEQESDRADSA